MMTAGIKELKTNLSRFLVEVKHGEEIYITERGRIIASIHKEPPDDRPSTSRRLRELEARDLVRTPSRHLRRKGISPLKTKGTNVSDIVLEGRR